MIETHISSKPDEALNPEMKKKLAEVALVIRGLSMDGVQKANSGHPGLPLGCAEIGAYLYGYALNQYAEDPRWMNRDRFILSAGHGSMLLYSCLHLAGYPVSLDDIKQFRQLHSNTPGHPESHLTVGVETTTGPLGQGVGNSVGHALGLKMLEQRFNTTGQTIFNPKVFCLMGDGCMMEGISHEASSLAGHLQLDNLILIYDSNHVSLDGPLSQSASEDTLMRYRAYGWDAHEIDGHDLDAIHRTITHVRKNQKKPTIIVAHTIIGKGSPHKAGTNAAHGSPLGPEEVKLTKEALGLPQQDFWVPDSVKQFFSEKEKQDQQRYSAWNQEFDRWAKENPSLLKQYETMRQHKLPEDLEQKLEKLTIQAPIAGRKASQAVIQELGKDLPFLIGGSADLSCSDNTMMKEYPLVTPGNFAGRNIKFGVREFAMAAGATGLYHCGTFFPFIGTFTTFSDYMRNAIRLASLQKAKVIYQFTHDSIFLGEDGPTHQPVEHCSALRAIPGLQVMRPSGTQEVKMAWVAALRYDGPTAILLSRQNIPDVPETLVPFSKGVGRGAYILRKEKGKPDYMLVATGSELPLATEVADELEKMGKNVRLISMPCWEIFENQDFEYRESVFGGDLGIRVSIEAAVSHGWYKYIGRNGIPIAVDCFGASAPYKALLSEYGFTKEDVLERIL